MSCAQVMTELYNQVKKMKDVELLNFMEQVAKEMEWSLRFDHIRNEYVFTQAYTYEEFSESDIGYYANGFGVEVILKSGLKISIEFGCEDGELSKELYIDMV